MEAQKKIKFFIIVSIAIFTIACNNAEKGKDTANQPAETVESTTTAPTLNKLPDTARQTIVQKCYSNDGLKYSTVITINYMPDNNVNGKVMSKELYSDKKEVAKFTGSIAGDKLIVKFVGKPPVVGAASDWTSKAWTIGNKSGKESLHIVFNAKNYETNKWAESDYEFELADCR